MDSVTTCSYNAGVTTVGIRELKAKLSAYLRRVKRGETVRVTDRGVVVAELRAPAKKPAREQDLSPDMAGLRRLIERGVVSEGGPNDPSLYAPTGLHCPPGTVQRLIDEDREDRC